MKPALITALLFVLTCCSNNQDKRLKAIEENFSINLPIKYEILEDSDQSFNGFESDYQQTLKLKFEKEEFDSIRFQLQETTYFNALHSFENKSITTPHNQPDSLHQSIIDSLKKVNQKGTWIIKENEYKFLFFGEPWDYYTGSLDLKELILTWSHIHL